MQYTVKQFCETILTVGVVFCAMLLLFSVVLEQVSLHSAVVALVVTYLFVHYWEKRLIRRKLMGKKQHVHGK